MIAIANHRHNPGRTTAVLDIGSSKICCLIGAMAPVDDNGNGALLVSGAAHLRSRGIKAGVVIDLAEAEQAVLAAVARAERMAQQRIDNVVLSVSCGRLQSANFTARAVIEGGTVCSSDIDRVIVAGHKFVETGGRRILHMNELGYALDGVSGIRDPRGMCGTELAMDIHAVSAEEAPLRNMISLVNRCMLSVSGLIAAPYASGLAAITDEEAELGVVCIDVGGGTTQLSLFADGKFIFSDAIASGGVNVTIDIARALSMPWQEAERIKTLYGSLVGATSDIHEKISFSGIGGDNHIPCETTVAALRDVIRPRVEETLVLINDRLQASGFSEYADKKLVLTGGASQLTGFGEFASHIFDRDVRVASPERTTKLPSSVAGPAYSTAVGIFHALELQNDWAGEKNEPDGAYVSAGNFGRVGQWFKESFWQEEQRKWAKGA